MSNTNRDYAIVYDVKNSSLVLSRPLIFYITDKNTSNIFVRLVTIVDVGNGIDQYTDLEPASNYALTMRVIKPNNEVKSIEATQHEPESIFQFDLTEDFKDIPGKYICELTISTIVNSRQELITSDPFNYEVKRSILSNVGEIIETEDTTVEKLLNNLDATKAELSSQIKENTKQQKIKKTTTSTPNNINNNTPLIVSKEYVGFNTKSNMFEGSSIHAITDVYNETNPPQGTVHGITSEVHYRNMGGDKRSELTPLFLNCRSDDGGSLWGIDLNINAPFPTNTKPYRLIGQCIRMSNYHDNPDDGSVGLSIVTVPGTGGAGEDRYSYESKPIDVGLAITGYSGKNDLSKTDVGFKTGLQIGGRVTGWQAQGENSEIGTAIELQQFLRGIEIKNIPYGTPIFSLKDGYSDDYSFQIFTDSGKMVVKGNDLLNYLMCFDKNGEVSFCNGGLVVTKEGFVRRQKNHGIAQSIPEGETSFRVSFVESMAGKTYSVQITPNWLTNYRVIGKDGNGFTVEFGTQAPIGATFDWIATLY